MIDDKIGCLSKITQRDIILSQISMHFQDCANGKPLKTHYPMELKWKFSRKKTVRNIPVARMTGGEKEGVAWMAAPST